MKIEKKQDGDDIFSKHVGTFLRVCVWGGGCGGGGGGGEWH